MNCSYHPETAATANCSACGRALCASCSHQIREKIFCQDCLVEGAEYATRARGATVDRDAPSRAAWLSVVPALGAIYNGQYLKAVTHFAVFAALCIMSDDVHGVFGWAAATFYFYMFFDSYRSAQQIRDDRLAGKAPAGPWSADDSRTPFWGILLIILGVLFTLHNLNIINFYFVRRLWPLIFIIVGGILVYRSYLRRSGDSEGSSPLKSLGF